MSQWTVHHAAKADPLSNTEREQIGEAPDYEGAYTLAMRTAQTKAKEIGGNLSSGKTSIQVRESRGWQQHWYSIREHKS